MSEPLVCAEAQPAPVAPQVPALALLRTLGLVAMISGGLIVLAYEWALPAIKENQRRAMAEGVAKVMPEAATRIDYDLTAAGLARVEGEARGLRVFAGYDASGSLMSLALEGAARGYQDLVKVLYSYRPDCQCITGFTVLYSNETPGFGDKVTTDPAFLANFKALDARLNAEQSALANPIKTVKHGRKTQPWEIDAISGATVTSRAIGKAMNDSAQKNLPLLAPHFEELRRMP